MKYTVFVGYRYEREWYSLTPEARREFHAEHVAPIVAKYAGRADVRFFGTSGLGTNFSNFLLVEARDLKYYYFLIEELRDSALLAQSLAVITKIFVGIEDGYSEFESEVAAATAVREGVGRVSFTVIVCYTLSSSWLAKSRPERDEFQALHVLPVLGKYADAVDARFYDAEAFETEFSDFIVLTVEDLRLYASLLEDLQGSAMYTEGYLELNDVMLGIEEIPAGGATPTQLPTIPTSEGETS